MLLNIFQKGRSGCSGVSLFLWTLLLAVSKLSMFIMKLRQLRYLCQYLNMPVCKGQGWGGSLGQTQDFHTGDRRLLLLFSSFLSCFFAEETKIGTHSVYSQRLLK